MPGKLVVEEYFHGYARQDLHEMRDRAVLNQP